MPSMWQARIARCEPTAGATSAQQAELNRVHEQYPEPPDGGLGAKAAAALAGGDKDNMFGGRNPLVPLGCLATAAVLCRGVLAMYQGDKILSQKMMRGRIVAQGMTVVTIAGGALLARTEAQRKRRLEDEAIRQVREQEMATAQASR